MAVQERVQINIVDGFTRGLESLGKGVDGINNKFANLSEIAGATFAGLAGIGIGGGLLGSMINESKQWAAAVNDIVDKTNMAGEEASKLLVVAKAVGLSAEDMGGAFMKMSKSANSARTSIIKAAAAGEASDDVFSKWGITILDNNGKLLSAEQILRNVTERHRNMADGVNKNALEMDIFGKSGGKLNDMLNLSDERMNEFIKTAQKAGLIISTETSAAWEKWEQDTRKVEIAVQGVKVQIGNELLPKIESMTEKTAELITKFSELDTETKSIITNTALTVAGMGALSLVIGGMGLVFTPFIGMLKQAAEWLVVIKTELAFMSAAGWLTVIGVGSVATATFATLYKGIKDYEHASLGGEFEYDELGNIRRKELPDTIAASDEWDKTSANFNPYELFDKLNKKPKPPPANDSARVVSGGGKDQASKYEQMLERYRKLIADIDYKIMDKSGTAMDKTLAQMNKELTKYGEDVVKIRKQGIDTSYLDVQIEKYKQIMQYEAEKAQLAEKTKNMEDQMSRTLLRADIEKLSADQIRGLRLQELAGYQMFLETQLNDTRLTSEERLEIEKKLVSSIVEQNNIAAYKMRDGWYLALDDLRNYGINYQSEFGNMFEDIGNNIANVFDNIAIEGDGMGQRLGKMWNNLGNTIINTLFRVAMQAIVVKPLMSWLGGMLGGGGGGGLGGIPFLNGLTPYGGGSPNTSWVPTRALGGYTDTGLVLVGEQGPELLDLNSPGRVYNNKELSNAVNNNSNGNVSMNYTIEVVNPPGQPGQVKSANIDPKSMVISIVMEAMANNTNGMRDTIRSMANTGG